MKLKAARDRFKRTGYWLRLTPAIAKLHMEGLRALRDEAQREARLGDRAKLFEVLKIIDAERARIERATACLNGGSHETR